MPQPRERRDFVSIGGAGVVTNFAGQNMNGVIAQKFWTNPIIIRQIEFTLIDPNGISSAGGVFGNASTCDFNINVFDGQIVTSTTTIKDNNDLVRTSNTNVVYVQQQNESKGIKFIYDFTKYNTPVLGSGTGTTPVAVDLVFANAGNDFSAESMDEISCSIFYTDYA